MRRLILLLLCFLLVVALGCGETKNTGELAATQSGDGQKDIAVPLAEGFPGDFPIIEGKITTSMINNITDAIEGKPVGTGYYTQIKTDQTIEQAMDFYRAKFTEIVKEQPLTKGSAAMYSGFINKHPVTIYFVEQKNKTMITIILSGGKK
ncbi:MAG: hypothetical protein Q8J63_07545 [Candidatus Aquicultor sp.]|nr:hypothetical protein [Candidatus Aquicultor sp.]